MLNFGGKQRERRGWSCGKGNGGPGEPVAGPCRLPWVPSASSGRSGCFTPMRLRCRFSADPCAGAGGQRFWLQGRGVVASRRSGKWV